MPDARNGRNGSTGASLPTRDLLLRAAALGVYVHFPWCLKKCPYCDFLSLPTDPAAVPHAAYADAVRAELLERRSGLADYSLQSVFFGGGTPSLWQPGELGRVLKNLLEAFDGQLAGTPDIEVTVECNPTSFTPDRARALRDQGVNRISLGVQALDQERLEFLGRWHSPDEALRAVRTAVDSGFPRVSADLIFGVAGQTPRAAARDAERLLDLGVTHLSAYALTIEPGTQFGALHKKGRLPLLPDDTVADSFLAVHDALLARGFAHYEISNYAKPGNESRHNLSYWRGQDYLGLGCGAFGTVTSGARGGTSGARSGTSGADADTSGAGSSGARGERRRYRNTPSPERYLAAAGAPDGSFEALEQQREVIDSETALTERILLGLRLAEGIDLEQVGRELGLDPWTPARRRAVEKLAAEGRLEQAGGRWRIPVRHWLCADDVIARVA